MHCPTIGFEKKFYKEPLALGKIMISKCTFGKVMIQIVCLASERYNKNGGVDKILDFGKAGGCPYVFKRRAYESY